MFFLNKKYYIPILEGIIKRGLNFNIWAYARVDSVREDQLELFKKAGVESRCFVHFGGSATVCLHTVFPSDTMFMMQIRASFYWS